jgi:RNAse (barnase) inhibitor barstar
MSKLLERLSDASKSGVYRATTGAVIAEACRDSDLRISWIDLKGVKEKTELLTRIARSLDFPQWWGKNWDALKDSLADLSWIKARGNVLVIDHFQKLPSDERQTLTEIFQEVAALGAKDGRPFFAVFVGGEAPLPELYRERR